MKKGVELFAGSRSVGRVAESMGMRVFSVDWEKYDGIHLSKDIEHLQPEEIPYDPDWAWCSPDCTTYSIQAISYHRNGILPKSEYAKKCDSVNVHVVGLLA